MQVQRRCADAASTARFTACDSHASNVSALSPCLRFTTLNLAALAVQFTCSAPSIFSRSTGIGDFGLTTSERCWFKLQQLENRRARPRSSNTPEGASVVFGSVAVPDAQRSRLARKSTPLLSSIPR
ncbi:hypothetical protein F442_13070 [Phytophthora nicotianae P10297]|uniref:Uncharacterized protein n=3 Tax=Phytophthora nicotianae TaxID=4792 RepID=W2R430_PHYN3|nr:hypothetical protein PPTG_21240 [Phytophthora nicotianae INRA-310]ETL88269.1 hypothetical protein L917_12642 [Phytophthora nicotianae]ETN20177.1 hypothetical protein PPTG_21240 [Phytophthora nicotianae INRA-310]ETP39469.1 hypothetical protein F442_13070 [Phytophthora nicotianae P10297]